MPSVLLYLSVMGVALYACVIGNMVSRGRLKGEGTSVTVECAEPENIDNEKNYEDEGERQ